MNQEPKSAGPAARGRVGARITFAAALMGAVCLLWVRPASAQQLYTCGEGTTVCGFVWNDLNDNGVQESGEPGLDGVTVSAFDGTDTVSTVTVDGGLYFIDLKPYSTDQGCDPDLRDDCPLGPYRVYIDATLLSTGTEVATANVGDDMIDSDGVDQDGTGVSAVVVTIKTTFDSNVIDFGFHTPTAEWPGTGTPGYWKTHPEAWPVAGISIGGLWYDKADVLAYLGQVGKDKTTTMFSSLVPAKLNVIIGNPDSCVAKTIDLADAWMSDHPLGAKVAGSSPAWLVGEPWHKQMDAYNNGLLCAPHRN